MNDLETEKAIQETESTVENVESKSPETGIETEANAREGAQMLESPADGSFVHGLQMFIAWVKTLVADK